MTSRPVQPSDLRLRRRERLRAAGVYLVTEEALSHGRSSIDIARSAVAAGVGILQLREKEGSARRALAIGWELAGLARGRGALFIVNDRLDLALLTGADGAHLGQDDLPIGVAREVLGRDAILGLSITHPRQLGAADIGEADYLGVGAVFPTASKDDAQYTGLDLLAAARAAVDVPIVAIGGITVANAPLAIRAGADVIAVISAIAAAADPGRAALELLAAVRGARFAPDPPTTSAGARPAAESGAGGRR